MKKLLLGLIALLIVSPVYAQCVAEVKDVVIDNQRGSIVVKTEYKLNGVIVDVKGNPSPEYLGQTRYTEDSGTNAEIIAKAKSDVAQHCGNLIRRIPVNQAFRQSESLKAQKALTEPIILDIKDDLVGYTTEKIEVEDTFKGKTIKVTADEKNTVFNTISVKPVLSK